MLKETYFAVVAKVKKANPNAVFYAAALKMPFFVDKTLFKAHLTVLAPTPELLKEFKTIEDAVGSKTAWVTSNYEQRFRSQILNDLNALAKLKELCIEAMEKDVYLVCWEKNYPCHRFLLLDLAREKLAEWKINVKIEERAPVG